MKTTHTPGPWETRAYKLSQGSYMIARVIDDRTRHIADAYGKANARLIAAAPELLAALEWAMEAGKLSYISRNNINAAHCDRIDAARTAIERAKQS